MKKLAFFATQITNTIMLDTKISCLINKSKFHIVFIESVFISSRSGLDWNGFRIVRCCNYKRLPQNDYYQVHDLIMPVHKIEF